MAVNRDLITATKQTPEYANGLTIVGDPDDYANQTMLTFVAFFFVMTVKEKGNVEELDRFLQDMGVAPVKKGEDTLLNFEDEEALQTAFTYIVGRTSKEYFEGFLKNLKEINNSRG